MTGATSSGAMHVALRLTPAMLVVAAVACGQADRGAVTPTPFAPAGPVSPAVTDPPGREAPPPAVAPAAPGCGGGVTIRLRGADGDGSGDRAIEVGAMTVRADGAPVEVRGGTTGMLDVTRDHAYDLGMVSLPENVSRVEVRVPVLGGRVGDDDADACTGPIDFGFDPAKVAPTRCHVVVQLDPWSFSALATASDPTPVIVPSFTIRY